MAAIKEMLRPWQICCDHDGGWRKTRCLAAAKL